MVDDDCLFIAAGDELRPTGWAVGPWSPDTLQASAYAGLLVRALERAPATAGMVIGRLGFDLWRAVTRDPITTSLTVLREGRKARTVEASLLQGGRSVARCTAVFLNADAAAAPPLPIVRPPRIGPDGGRPVPAHVRAWSPFFSGIDTRVVEGDLLAAGPASAWFRLQRALVGGEDNSPLVHATSAADLASGISAVVDLRTWTFVNADLTLVLWRVPRPPWVLLEAETYAGDRGTGVARGTLSDVNGPFGGCTQTLLFERRR
jgi:Acyl-CoA thioesterase C-terminal domain/Acyl-CoA thioesterase N-terminal domain